MAPRGPQPGDVIGGKYRLEVLIGTGGMGAVWSAKEDAREVAVKFLHARMAADPMIVQRFVLEARAGAKIEHPNVVRILDSGRQPYGDESVPFLVMELLSGQTLADALRGRPKLAPAEAGALVADVASGAAAAHRAGIVHRDLKPANVFLHHGGGSVVPKILDFGISKFTDPALDGGLTTTGAVMGSTTYMSPEQATGAKDVDARSDVWSLGVLLYRLLTGDSPLPAAQSDAMLALVGPEELPLESLQHATIPPALAEVVRKCLKKRREDRFVNGVDLEAAIRAAVPTGVASDLTLIDGPPPIVSGWVDAAPLAEPRRAPVVVLAGMAAVFVFVVGAGATMVLVRGRAAPTRPTAAATVASSAPEPAAPSVVESAVVAEPPPPVESAPRAQAHAPRVTKAKPAAPKPPPPAASAPPAWRTPGF